MALSRDDLVSLLDAFEAYGWSELILTVDGTRIELTSSGRPPASTASATWEPAAPRPAAPRGVTPAKDRNEAQPSAPATAAPLVGAPDVALHEVRSPSVGIFYVAPEPGAPPFVEVGGRVSADDIVCIVEVMKLMNHVKAGIDGVVRAVHAVNGAMVEHGQPLFSIEPDQ
jgi:acetyl-CoA carboxylase biotin carboxyl carrier protein